MSSKLFRVFCLTIFILAATCSLAAEDQERVFKPYKPFDEPRPKLAAQITEDARLDVKVTVHAKSVNMKDLFAQLSKVTGVKLVVGREIWAERPIVYMHDRPLRDVMLEVANLYGYYWLVKGTPGDWSYELFQDLRHAQRREQLAREKKDMLDNCVLESIRKGSELLDDPEAMRKAAQDDPAMAKALADPANRDAVRLLSMLDQSLLAGALTNGVAALRTADLPTEWQQTMLDVLNSNFRRGEDRRRENGEEPRDYVVFDLADIRQTDVSIRSRIHSVFGMPSLVVSVFPNGENRIRGGQTLGRWPNPLDDSSLSELDQLAELVDPGTDAEKVIGDPLPAKPGITIEKGSRIDNGYAVRLGDALEAIADQGKLDIVADYYYQLAFMGTVKDQPVNKYVEEVCGAFGYTCQVEKATLRLRFNSWFEVTLMEEPPAELVERMWTNIETVGRASLDDLLELGRIPDAQLGWGGFRFIPGVNQARTRPSTLRLWGMLAPAQVEMAESDEGLKPTDLTAEQQDKLYAWAKVLKPLISLSDLVQSRLVIRTVESDSITYKLILNLPDGNDIAVWMELPKPLPEKDRKELADQRKADAAADRIERASLD